MSSNSEVVFQGGTAANISSMLSSSLFPGNSNNLRMVWYLVHTSQQTCCTFSAMSKYLTCYNLYLINFFWGWSLSLDRIVLLSLFSFTRLPMLIIILLWLLQKFCNTIQSIQKNWCVSWAESFLLPLIDILFENITIHIICGQPWGLLRSFYFIEQVTFWNFKWFIITRLMNYKICGMCGFHSIMRCIAVVSHSKCEETWSLDALFSERDWITWFA